MSGISNEMAKEKKMRCYLRCILNGGVYSLTFWKSEILKDMYPIDWT
jgi:hypothetical protein